MKILVNARRAPTRKMVVAKPTVLRGGALETESPGHYRNLPAGASSPFSANSENPRRGPVQTLPRPIGSHPFCEEVPLRLSLPDIIAISRQVRRALSRRTQKTRDAELCKRYLIIVLLAEGQSSVAIERSLKVARAHVSRTAWKDFGAGIGGLQDRREENGDRKVDENFLSVLQELLVLVPSDCGWERSRWSRELLAREMAQRTGIQVSRSTLGICLKILRVRWGRARARVLCPWRSQPANRSRLDFAGTTTLGPHSRQEREALR